MKAKAWHKHLGKVYITDSCIEMEKHNADSSSMCVETPDGDIIEVTRCLVTVEGE